MDAAYAYCQTLVRERDKDRFLATLFAPKDKRPHLFALHAFDLEAGRIPDLVSEPMAGEIRLQWWRDAIGGERAGEAEANPVARALLDTIVKHELPREPFLALLDARSHQMSRQFFETIAELELFLDATSVAVIGLGARILSGLDVAPMAAAIFAAGRAIGFTKMLRDLPFDASNARIMIPAEILAAHGASAEDILNGKATPLLRTVLEQLRDRARAEWSRIGAAKIPAPALAALLPAALVPLYLSAMERKGFEPFRPPAAPSQLRRQFALWRAARRGTV